VAYCPRCATASTILHARTVGASADVSRTSPRLPRSCMRLCLCVLSWSVLSSSRWSPLPLLFRQPINQVQHLVKHHFAIDRQSILFRHASRGHVVRADQGNNVIGVQYLERIVHAGSRHFRRVTFPLLIASHLVTDLRLHSLIGFLHDDAAAAYQLPGRL